MPRDAHVHAEVIKAWADGKEVQVETPNGWKDFGLARYTHIRWRKGSTYRVRPDYIKTPTGWKEL